MRILTCWLICFSVLYACNLEYKKCEVQTSDEYLKAYNDILIEINTNRSYGLYLGEDEEKIFEKYRQNIADSDKIEREVTRLHNKLFGDTSRYCTVYYDTLLKPSFNSWLFLKADTNQFHRKLFNVINRFSSNGESIIDSLNSIQQKYLPKDFQTCIFAFKSITETEQDHGKCYAGNIVFSKMILSSLKNKGLLYYEYRCGGLCGYGSLIMIEKTGNFCRIKESLRTWVA